MLRERERERERSSFAVEWRRFRGHVHMMSTQGGEEGVTQKADKSTNKLRVSVKVTGGNPKSLWTSYVRAPSAVAVL